MKNRFRIFSVMSIMFLLAVMPVHSLDTGGEEQPAAADPQQSVPKKDFFEDVLQVNMIVHDVLYAGLSTSYITEFLPVETELSKMYLKDLSGPSYRTPEFYLYGMASSKSTISVRLRYGKASQDPADPTSRTGFMYSMATPKNDVTIPITLNGSGLTPASTMPIVLDLITAGNDEQGFPVTHTAVSCTDKLWFEVDKNAILERPTIDGSYKADIVVEVWIDGRDPNEGASE